MKVRAVHTWPARLPADDDHPYRTGAWRPNRVEYDADELDVVEGAIPPELDGVYLRNTENPLHPAIGRYHPFDGDGMVHAIRLGGGRASYRNRAVRTAGLAAEDAAGGPLWAGIIEPPARSVRDGWGARGRMKDASSTDVIVHAGAALTTFYQGGDVYAHDPVTLAERGVAAWSGAFPWGVSAHPKLDPATGELLVWSYGTTAPYLRYGVIDRAGALVHTADVPLPGPRLPHDLAFTERFVIWNDLPLYWDPALLAEGVYRPRFYRDQPARFGIMPRRGTGADVRWFPAAPTYVLHWINAFEDGDEVVLDGYFQRDPTPRPDPADGPWAGLKKMVDLTALGARPHRWRFDLRTGATREEPLADAISEFPSIHPRRGGRRHRYAWSMTAPPGWFLFDGLVRLDLDGGAPDHYQFPDRVYASEAPMVPRPGATREDDGWVVTFVSDLGADTSECQIFAADRVSAGPIARVRLPERICSGTHACWAGAEELGG
ncbi:MAG: carotenoid oxygenase family protein [Myxococcales bacterium]|nr:carotenoid oxygenase family protein [Myxococcales bacterium]